MTGRNLEVGDLALMANFDPEVVRIAGTNDIGTYYYTYKDQTAPRHFFNRLEDILEMFPRDEVHRAINIWHEKRTRPDKKIHNPKTGKDYKVTEHSSKYDPDKKIKGLWKPAPLSEEESYE